MAQKLKQEPEHMNSESITDCDQEGELPTSILPTDILKEIFSYLPPKSLFRFKSVSKSCRDFAKQADFISKYSINSNRRCPNVTGLFYQTLTFSLNQDVEFLSTNSSVELPGLGFLKQRSEKQRSEIHGIELFDSCNGLLLCSTITNGYNPVKTVYVCNPLTRQKVAIPHPQRPSNEVCYALLANLTDSGLYQFKVVCLHRLKDRSSGTELLIYSSETGAWDTKKERLPELRNEDRDTGTKVFFNGRLFWDCFCIDKILVCHLKSSSPGGLCVELIEAPAAPRGRSLFIYDQNLICYFHKHKRGAWCLRSDDKTKNKLYWEFIESCLYFKNLKQDLTRICREGKMNLHSWYLAYRYKIIAFDHTSDTIFFLFQDSIFTYQVKMRTFDILLRDNYPSGRRELRNFGVEGCVLNYTHSLGRIQEGTGAEMGKEREKKSSGVHLDDDLVDWTSLMEKNANMVKQRGRRR